MIVNWLNAKLFLSPYYVSFSNGSKEAQFDFGITEYLFAECPDSVISEGKARIHSLVTYMPDLEQMRSPRVSND